MRQVNGYGVMPASYLSVCDKVIYESKEPARVFMAHVKPDSEKPGRFLVLDTTNGACIAKERKGNYGRGWRCWDHVPSYNEYMESVWM